MIQVRQNPGTQELELTFKYDIDYIDKLRTLPCARWNPEQKIWIISDLFLDQFENLFRGEIVYLTPRWVITGEQPPDYSKIYSHIKNKYIPLKEPYKPYPFQAFGANFLVEQAKLYKMALLADDMGVGKTIQSIEAALILDSEVDLLQYDIPILVICKSGLKYQWVTDGVNKFTDATSIVVDGTKAKRKKIYDNIKKNPGAYEYVIFGYETIREDIDLIKDIHIGLVIANFVGPYYSNIVM